MGICAVLFISVLTLLGTCLQAQLRSVASAAEKTAVPGQFTDITAFSGVDFVGVASHTSHKYLIETMGSRAAAFDFDTDGRLDLFLSTAPR